jgi:hypothetical protein
MQSESTSTAGAVESSVDESAELPIDETVESSADDSAESPTNGAIESPADDADDADDAGGLGAVTRAEIQLASGAVLVLELTLETADSDIPIRWAVERDSYFPQFGQRVERSLLVGRCNAFEAGNWAFELRPRAGNAK